MLDPSTVQGFKKSMVQKIDAVTSKVHAGNRTSASLASGNAASGKRISATLLHPCFAEVRSSLLNRASSGILYRGI